MDNAVIVKKRSLGPTHDLLLDLCPPNEHGIKSIAVLSALLGIEPFSLYAIIRKNQPIPLKLAKKLVALCEGRITLDELKEKGFVRRNPIELTKRDLGPVQRLLLKACPPDEDGAVSLNKLAKILKVAPPSVFRWCHLRSIPQGRAQALVDLSDGRLTMDDVLPFVISR